jgi:hypothetical protein
MKKKKNYFKCARCDRAFDTHKKLVLHSRQHIEAGKNMILLKQGFQPDETKLGAGFRGKNRIIVA